jgi:hypothetical protein
MAEVVPPLHSTLHQTVWPIGPHPHKVAPHFQASQICCMAELDTLAHYEPQDYILIKMSPGSTWCWRDREEPVE